MKRKPKSKSDNLAKLTEELDRVFSRYIRLSHANEKGYAMCVTCNKVSHWKDLHCGHFVSRRHKSTRWDEKNVGPQCPGCNIYNQGAGPAFASYLMRKYGHTIVDLLLQKSHQVCRMSKFEYELLINEYKTKLQKYDTVNQRREEENPVRVELDQKKRRVYNRKEDL